MGGIATSLLFKRQIARLKGGVLVKITTIIQIIKLGRLRFLAGGFLLFTLGALLAILAGSPIDFEKFFFGYAIMLPAHLALSYSNNYFDVQVDQFNEPCFISGGTKILQSNAELRSFCLWFSLALMVLSLILAVVFIIIFAFPLIFLAFILFGNFLGWFYSAPPLRLAYNGLGELSNMITMGILMPGLGYWVIRGGFDPLFLTFAIPFLLYGLDFIISVETPDMEGDKQGKKQTLVVRKGRRFGFRLTLLSVLASTCIFLIIWITGAVISPVNFFLVFLFSMIPLLVAAPGVLKKNLEKKTANTLATANMVALIAFIVVIDIYFLLSVGNLI
jgi:1,4-dihydroxy-2-naphthoate octaprenyltransferase